MKDKNILVTGATGFLGSHVVRELLDNSFNHIYAIHRSTSSYDLIKDVQDQVTWIEADLDDLPILDELIEQIDVIVHAAAMVSFVPKMKSKLMNANVIGTSNLVDLAIYHQVEHFVFISSVAALGRDKNRPLIDESSEWVDGPLNSTYGISKHKAELEVRRGEAEGLNISIINPSYILGVGNWDEGATAIYQKIYHGMPFYPKGTNGVVDVKDVALLTRLLVEQKEYGKQIIACAQNLKHKELFTKIATALNKKPPSRMINGFIAAIGWRVEAIRAWMSGNNPIATKESIAIAQCDFVYNNSQSLMIKDFQYRDVDQTIKNVCDAYLKTRYPQL